MPAIQLKNNHRRSNAMLTMVWIFVFMNILCVLMCIATLFYNYALGKYDGDDLMARIGNKAFWIRELTAGLLNYISAVFFIRWSLRANRNLTLINDRKNYTGFWIIGAWFIPVASWFIPYRIMRRLFTRTMDQLGRSDQRSAIRVVNHWWMWWLILCVYGYADSVITQYYPVNQHTNLHLYLKLVAMGLALIVDFTTIRLIRTYSVLETELYTQQSASFFRLETDELIDTV